MSPGLERLVDDFYGPVLKLLTSLSGSTSAGEELAQATFTGLFSYWEPFGRHEDDRAYVLKAAYNVWRKSSRPSGPELLDPSTMDQLEADQTTTLDRLCVEEEIAALHLAIGQLPRKQRAAFVLISMHGMRYQEVADIMGVPRNTVAKWRNRAMTRLRDTMCASVRIPSGS